MRRTSLQLCNLPLPLSLRSHPSSSSSWASTRTCGRRRRFDVVAVFREARAINQRNLLPRFAVGGAIFYAAEKTHLIPLHTRPFQGERCRLRLLFLVLRTEDSALFLSLRMHEKCARETRRRFEGRNSKEKIAPKITALTLSKGREGGLLAGRLARISLDLISFWPGRLLVAPRVERTTGETLGALCIILILCATPREKARGIRIRGGSARCTPFPFSRR